MTDNPALPYVVGDGEKVAAVMAYTHNQLIWGEVVVKEIVRVSTWLRTNSAPDDVCIYNARILFTSGGSVKPLFMREAHLAAKSILAFHLVPPAKDPVDYDPSEPNRRMEPVSAIVSNFKVDGFLRMSTQATLAKYLEISKENFTSVYDAEITSPLLPSLGIIKTAYLLVRQANTIYTTRQLPTSAQ